MREYGSMKFPHKFGNDYCTDLRPMQSAAGWYLGRYYFDDEMQCPFPYSRESDYFPTKEAAEKALQQGHEPRNAPENAHLPIAHQPEHN